MRVFIIYTVGMLRRGKNMLPEEKARVKIDKQLNNAGWNNLLSGYPEN